MVDDEGPGDWLTVPEAAEKLGITEGNLRVRMTRRRVRSRKDNQGRVTVFVPDGVTTEILHPENDDQPAPQDGENKPETAIPLSVLEEMQAVYNDVVGLQRHSYEERLTDQKTLYEGRVDRQDHQQALDSQKERYEAQITDLKAQHAALTAAQQDQIDFLRGELEKGQEAAREQIQAVEARHQELIKLVGMLLQKIS